MLPNPCNDAHGGITSYYLVQIWLAEYEIHGTCAVNVGAEKGVVM